MDQRLQLVADARRSDEPYSALCAMLASLQRGVLR